MMGFRMVLCAVGTGCATAFMCMACPESAGRVLVCTAIVICFSLYAGIISGEER